MFTEYMTPPSAMPTKVERAWMDEIKERVVPDKEIVRVRTSTWSDRRGVHVKKSVTFLRKQSSGIGLLDEEISAVGAEDTVAKILNLDACSDGVYRVIVCNQKRDWETGYIDDYDFRLEPLS